MSERVLNPQYPRLLSKVLKSSATFLKEEIELAKSCDDDHAYIAIAEPLTTVAKLESGASFLMQIADASSAVPRARLTPEDIEQARAKVEGAR